MERKLKILVAPLNWGLGHATRLVPVIRRYRSEGHEVLLGGEGNSLAFLREEFPNLQWVDLPSFSPRFSKKSRQVTKLIEQLPRFFYMIWREHRNTKAIVKKYGIDVVISDNRYGVRSRRCHSIIITHQLSPFINQKQGGFRRRMVSFGIDLMVAAFDGCWIPDNTDGESLVGDLAVPVLPLKNIVRIGLLSRFNPDEALFSPGGAPLAMISGPEPQRTLFEEKVIRFFEQRDEEAIIIRGLPLHPQRIERRGKNILLSHCNSQEFALLIRSARYIVCRSGYSTIMDLMILGRRALLVPTPGQPEQEYLAVRMGQFGFESTTQDNLLFLDRHKSFHRISSIFTPMKGFRGVDLNRVGRGSRIGETKRR